MKLRIYKISSLPKMVGRSVSHFKITEKLGSGGKDVVYKVEDTKLKRTVAIKCLLPQLLINSDDRKRFEQEAQTAAHLNQTGIATISGLAEVDNQMYIKMESIEGRDLHGILGNLPGVGINSVHYLKQYAITP